MPRRDFPFQELRNLLPAAPMHGPREQDIEDWLRDFAKTFAEGSVERRRLEEAAAKIADLELWAEDYD